MKFRLVVVGAVALGVACASQVPAAAHHLGAKPHFKTIYCDPIEPGGAGPITYPYQRWHAAGYGQTAVGDGYQWGGGCWNASHVDDQPGDPTLDVNTGGEGGDCSGFVFKVWALKESGIDGGFYGYDIYKWMHGPFNTASYESMNSAQVTSVNKSNVEPLDAFVYNNGDSGHIGFYLARDSARGGDLVLEAKSEAQGTVEETRTYRSDSNYVGKKRLNWYVPSCPNPTEVNGPTGMTLVPVPCQGG